MQAAVTARYQNDSATDLGDDPRFAIPGYTLVNASISVHDNDDKCRLSFWAQNLTDVNYWTSVSSNVSLSGVGGLFNGLEEAEAALVGEGHQLGHHHPGEVVVAVDPVVGVG